ncbi:MAG: envelope stress response membrane protein PspC [Desulfobacteraceae bacterium]|nr:MAG: envelope stress response membrane protein PspC [Desulfobacteraceae bacterium]
MKKINDILRGGLYRSRNGAILGVCRGIAEYFDFSVFWTRAIAVVLLFLTGLWPVTGLYFLAALLMKPEPVLPIADEDERDFYHSYLHSRRTAVGRLKKRYEDLERRIQRMEDRVTSREFDWEARFK